MIALHLATTRDEVVKLIKEGEVDQREDSVVIELTINFPGLNLPRLNYVLAISTSWLLLVQCPTSPCNHPPGHTSQLLSEYDRDAEFGFSISPLFDIVSAALPSVTLPILSNLLRRAHIFFWPLAKVNLASLRMEPALSLSAGNKPETSTADVVRLEKTGRRKMRGGKVGSFLFCSSSFATTGGDGSGQHWHQPRWSSHAHPTLERQHAGEETQAGGRQDRHH